MHTRARARIFLPLSQRSLGIAAGLCVLFSSLAEAQTIPGPADAGRIKPEEKLPKLRSTDAPSITREDEPITDAPAAAKSIHFTLKAVKIENVTAFAPDELADIYKPYIGKDITLDMAWMFAGSITERYRSEGYFLSRAYVPAQSIKDGTIVIKVIEGYVGEVEIKDPKVDSPIIYKLIQDLKQEKPARAQSVESMLLRLNDLPGHAFRAVLSATKNAALAEQGATKLTLVPTTKKNRGIVSFDNFGSRFLGPNEVSASYQMSFLPMQETSVSLLTSVPVKELKYGTLSHKIMLSPRASLILSGGVTQAHPGYSLTSFNIDSHATTLAAGIDYQLVRQREINWNMSLKLDGRNVDSDLLSTPLTRDRVRAVRVGSSFDTSDAWNGYNSMSVTFSQGLAFMGASRTSDPNISRAGAKPDFRKGELFVSRLQPIARDWSVYGAGSGQIASGILYSSEEFGFGGINFGRAFDASDLTGDHGVAGALEVRYGGLANGQTINLMPYAFYDVGRVWSESSATPGSVSASSAGFGLRFDAPKYVSGTIGMAFPLTGPDITPTNGEKPANSRFLLQITKEL